MSGIYRTPRSSTQTGMRIQRRGAEISAEKTGEKTGEKTKNEINGCWAPVFMVGRSPWTAADAPVGLFARCKMPTALCRRRDGGVLAQRAPRPRGPPHQCCDLGAYTA